MKLWYLCEMRGALQLLLAPDVEAAKVAAEPGFEDEQPDRLFEVTDLLVTAASNLIGLARERIGEGTDSHYRYDVDTLIKLWRGEPAPDEWRERYAIEFRRRLEGERALASVYEELASTKEALLALDTLGKPAALTG